MTGAACGQTWEMRLTCAAAAPYSAHSAHSSPGWPPAAGGRCSPAPGLGMGAFMPGEIKLRYMGYLT